MTFEQFCEEIPDEQKPWLDREWMTFTNFDRNILRGEKVRAALEPHERDDPDWPRTAERFLNGVFEREIEKRGAKIQVWNDAKKGDVLIWHSWLAHRGSKPKNPELLRKSLICHYSGIHHRPDMQPVLLYENGESKGYFFPF